jgi:branched-chain amino acid transport system substrate-binding protein
MCSIWNTNPTTNRFTTDMKTNWTLPRLALSPDLSVGGMMKLSALVLLLAACGQPPAEEQKEPAQEPIKVGVILPLTGPAASAGADSRNGLLLAQEEINADTSGKYAHIELDIQDSKAQAKDAVSAMQQMIAMKKPDAVYAQLSNVAMAIKPITEPAGIPLIAVSGAAALLDSSRLVYRNYPNPNYLAEQGLLSIKKQFGITELGIVFANSEFAASMKEALLNAAKSNGMTIKFEIPYDPAASDQSTVGLNVRQHGNIPVYVIGVGSSLGQVIKKLRDGGMVNKIFGGMEIPYEEVLGYIAPTDTAVYYLDIDLEATSMGAFTAAYDREYGRSPSAAAFLGYAAMYLLSSDRSAEHGFTGFPEGATIMGLEVSRNEILYPVTLKRVNK